MYIFSRIDCYDWWHYTPNRIGIIYGRLATHNGDNTPLSLNDWTTTFEAYQATPEFKHIHSTMTLSGFKAIFFWEYLHRILGRLIGLLAVIPFIIFWWRRDVSPGMIKRWLGILLLIAMQGFMGWYMVKSGLVDRPHVSHLRLAAHLLLALIIFTMMLVEFLRAIRPPISHHLPHPWSIVGFIVIGTQIMYGAFLAGLHGASYYNTYPKMGMEWLPESAWMYPSFFSNIIHNPIMVQWIHRWLAVSVVIIVCIIWGRYRRHRMPELKWSVWALLGVAFGQFILGVATLLSAAWLPLALAHQLGGLFLLSTLTTTVYFEAHHR